MIDAEVVALAIEALYCREAEGLQQQGEDQEAVPGELDARLSSTCGPSPYRIAYTKYHVFMIVAEL